MVKKGFMKTMEILLVIVLTTIFILTILPKQSVETKGRPKFYLNNVEDNPEFRDFVINNDGCFNSTEELVPMTLLRGYIDEGYDFRLCVNNIPETLPNKDITVDTLFFSGNVTDIDYKTLRLYYWVR